MMRPRPRHTESRARRVDRPGASHASGDTTNTGPGSAARRVAGLLAGGLVLVAAVIVAVVAAPIVASYVSTPTLGSPAPAASTVAVPSPSEVAFVSLEPEPAPTPAASPVVASTSPSAAAVAASPSASASPAPTASAPAAPSPTPKPSAALRPARPGVVPILYYHRAEAPPPAFLSWPKSRRSNFLRYDVLPTALAAQLDWLVAHGYTTILPRDLAAHWDRGTQLPKRPVIITFDDGFHSWMTTVLPLLRQRHQVAEFYLTLDAIRHGDIRWSEVRTLAAAGNGIGAHDVHHVQLAALGPGRPPATPAVMWAEVKGARDIIGAQIGVPPDSMAYVGGGFDATLASLVAKAGYTTARSIIRGVVQAPAKRFAMRVVRIGARDDVTDVVEGAVVEGVPHLTARQRGVSDLRS